MSRWCRAMLPVASKHTQPEIYISDREDYGIAADRILEYLYSSIHSTDLSELSKRIADEMEMPHSMVKRAIVEAAHKASNRLHQCPRCGSEKEGYQVLCLPCWRAKQDVASNLVQSWGPYAKEIARSAIALADMREAENEGK